MSPFRLALFNLHKWLGFLLALYFAAIFLTGTILVFTDDVEALVHPASLKQQPDLRVEEAFPAYLDHLKDEAGFPAVMTIIRPETGISPDYATAWQTGGARKLWMGTDPVAVLAEGKTVGFAETIRLFHTRLWVPRNFGYLLVTGLSVVLGFIVIAGLTSYRRFWRGLARLPARDSTPRMRRAAWHRLLGAWSSWFLLLMAVTGFVFFLYGAGIMKTDESANPIRVSQDISVYPKGPDLAKAMAAAVAAVPELEIHQVVLPNIGGETYLIVGKGHGMSLTNQVRVEVHPVDFSILGINRASEANASNMLIEMTEILHYGHWGGAPVRWLWFVLGLAATALAIFGTMVRLARTEAVGRYWKAVWRELGIFRWAYVLGILASIAAFILTQVL